MSMLRAVLSHRRASAGGNNITVGVTASKAATASSLKTVTTTGVTTQTTGSDFFVIATWYNSTTAPVITDSKSNPWTQIGTNVYNSTDGTGMAVFRSLNATGGTSHTFTMTSGAGTYVSMCMLEIKGSSHVIDQSAQGTAASGTSASSGNITTTNANDILIGFCYVDSEATTQAITANSPFTLQVSVGYTVNNIGCGISTNLVTSTQTVAATFSGTPSATYMGALITSVKSS